MIAKLDAVTGTGLWIRQAGGPGADLILGNSLQVDADGDVYVIAASWAHPLYFDPLVVDTHTNSSAGFDGYDIVIAKLKASNEILPECKTNATTVNDGFCFIGNVATVPKSSTNLVLRTPPNSFANFDFGTGLLPGRRCASEPQCSYLPEM